MSCLITYTETGSSTPRALVRGSRPSGATTWCISAWVVLPTGEKHTHSATVPAQTVETIVPWMSALIDTLLAEHGNQVSGAGWTAISRGTRPGPRRKPR